MKSYEERKEAELKVHYDNIFTVAITSDNKFVVSGGEDQRVKIWNLQGESNKIEFYGHDSSLLRVMISHDNRYANSGGKNGYVRVWSFQEKQQVAKLEGHTHWIHQHYDSWF